MNRFSKKSDSDDAIDREHVAGELSVALLLHELQGRVASVAMFAGEVSQQLESRQAGWTRDRLLRIGRTAAEMQSILDAVRRIQEGSAPDLTTIDVSQMAAEVVRRHLERSREFERTAVVIQPSIKIVGDARELRIVLENLLGNALKYSARQSAPCVWLDSTNVAGRTAVHINDNGVGIAPEDTARIFAPFARIHRDFDGIGLGLTVTKRIVERHGGRIWANGELGSGTTISFIV